MINCGSDSDPIQLKEARFTDCKLQNSLCGKIRFEVKENITAPIQIKYQLDRTYLHMVRFEKSLSDRDRLTDICPLLVSEGNKCPGNRKNRIKLPCRCPIPKGTYFAEKSIYVPSFVEDGLIGDYRAKLRGWHSKERLICYNATFTIDNTS
ncbi:hypothetical protein C0J52_14650 [Blattella germanica]|nr:hypothetical protein C0J52_14650 [Blattella germanica]